MGANPDIASLSHLKKASVLLVIATAIGVIGGVFNFYYYENSIVAIVSFILILIAIPFLRKAFQGFLQTGKNVGNGITGAKILPWGFLLIAIVGIIAVGLAVKYGGVYTTGVYDNKNILNDLENIAKVLPDQPLYNGSNALGYLANQSLEKYYEYSLGGLISNSKANYYYNQYEYYSNLLSEYNHVNSSLNRTGISPDITFTQVVSEFHTISTIASIMPILIILGVILEFVAGALIGLSIYNVGRFYSSILTWISGILIIIPFTAFVGWILTYAGVDDIVNKLTGRSMPMQPGYQQPYSPQQGYQSPPQPMQPTYQPYQPTPQPIIVYQTGNGQLTEDGKAVFSLYSNGQIQIMSASIDNTTIAVGPDKIIPQTLSQGNNSVMIQFPPLANLGFIKQKMYTVTITLSNRQSIKVYVIFT